MTLGRLQCTNYQYITNTCNCVESLHYFAWFAVCFPVVIIAQLYGFDPYICFPCIVNVQHSHVPVLLAMQWRVAWRSAFYGGREYLWIVFSFNLNCFLRWAMWPMGLLFKSIIISFYNIQNFKVSIAWLCFYQYLYVNLKALIYMQDLMVL